MRRPAACSKLFGSALPMMLVRCAVVDGSALQAIQVDDPAITVIEHHHIGRLLDHVPFPDATGTIMTVSTTDRIDLGNEFFQDLGTNGRRCISCHLPSAGWTITPSRQEAAHRRLQVRECGPRDDQHARETVRSEPRSCGDAGPQASEAVRDRDDELPGGAAQAQAQWVSRVRTGAEGPGGEHAPPASKRSANRA